MSLRCIGDAHGKIDWNILGRPSYLDRIEGCGHSVQVGDMGDAEAYSLLAEKVDPRVHRFVPGNHDDYDHLPAHALGDFGLARLGGVEFFFVRGAFSVDKALRLRSKIPWWPQEEMGEERMEEAVEAYRTAGPAIVVSHTCPLFLERMLGDPEGLREYELDPGTFASRTGGLLERMHEVHPPRLWVFGHFHRDVRLEVEGTLFVGLGELSALDLDDGGAISG